MILGHTDITGNIDLVKQLNSAIVYRTIVQQGPISRIKIAESTQLAPASITKITRQFLKIGLIEEVEQLSSTGGRPPVSIVAVTKPFHTIAIHLSRKNITIEFYDLSGQSLAFEQYPIKFFVQHKLERFLIDCIEAFITQYQRKIIKLIAISIVLPGLIDEENGIVNYIPNMKVENWHLTKLLSEHFHLPCFVGHNIRALALAEHYFGITQDCLDSMLIRIHRGIGTGIIINRQIFLSKNHYSGELGHIQVDPLGDRCHCGNFGCLESFVSNDALKHRALHLLRQGWKSQYLTIQNCNIETICHAAMQKDPLAVEIIHFASLQLGKVIAMTLNIINPQKLVITGDIALAADILFPAIKASIAHQTLSAIWEKTSLETSHLNHRSAIGAFALVQQAMFNSELLRHLINP